MTLSRPIWTDERVEELKKLWSEGHSARWIGSVLGGFTKPAVIGKANRLGLARRRTCNRDPKDIAHRLRGRHGAVKTTALKPPKYEAVQLAPAPVEPLNLDVMDLAASSCRWPTSLEAPHLFCGHPREGEHSAYCPFHQKLSVRPEPPASMEKFAAWISRREYRVNTGQREAA